MKRIVILTVGTNALPCLIAAGMLRERWRDDPPEFVVLYSEVSKQQLRTDFPAVYERVFHEKFECDFIFLEDPRNPTRILEEVRRWLSNKVDDRTEIVHVSYTGGAKTMGIHTLEAVLNHRCDDLPFSYETSYLNPNNRRLEFAPVPDNSEQPDITLMLADLAKLHGFYTDFKDFSKRDPVRMLRQPQDGCVNLALKMTRLLVDEDHMRPYNTWHNRFQNDWKNKNKKTAPWFAFWHKTTESDMTDAMKNAAASWSEFCENELFCWFGIEQAWSRPNLDLSALRNTVPGEDFYDFTSHYFELAVYRALRLALDELGLSVPVYWSCDFARETQSKRTFEIDLAVVIGYQLLAISCTTGQYHAKLKAFEVWHRARQVGGDEARALLVTLLPETATKEDDITSGDLLRDVKHETGLTDPFQVWGSEKYSHLKDEFKSYIQKHMLWTKK